MAKYVNLDDYEVVYCGSDGDYEKYNIPYDMPTADVVEVVRCKDCKYHKDEQNEWGLVYCSEVVDGFVGKDSFCSWGERRDDGRDPKCL